MTHAPSPRSRATGVDRPRSRWRSAVAALFPRAPAPEAQAPQPQAPATRASPAQARATPASAPRGPAGQPLPVAPQRSWRAAGVALGVLLAGTVISLLRHPGTVALDTVYAEDGTIFLAEAVDGSIWSALFTSYNGYYHLVPRVLGGIAALGTPGAAAVVLAVAAAVVTAALAILVYVASASHLPSTLARVLVAAPVVVAPLAQEEVPNAVANLHWPALYAMFWLLIWTPASRAGRLVATAGIGLTALSDILVVVFLPLALGRLWLRRDRHSAALAVTLGIGVLVQLSGLLVGSSSRETSLDPIPPAAGFVLRAVPSAVFGERWLPESGTDPQRLLLAGLAWLVLALVVLVALRGITRPSWVLAGAAALHSLGLYALPVVLTGIAPPRYAFAPALLLLTAMVAVLLPTMGSAWPRRGTNPLWLLAVGCAAVWVLNFQVDTPREHGPRWSTELDTARETCQTVDIEMVIVQVTPDDPEWRAVLPCAYVTGAG